MATKAETRIVRDIMQWLKKQGGDAWHVHGSALQRAGEPDICGSLLVGDVWVHLKLEVKTSTGEPSKLQLHRIREYRRMNYCAGVVTSIQEVRELIRNYTKET